MMRKKTSAKTPDSKTRGKARRQVELVTQPHGGALQKGNPGNRGGGRPADEVRARFLRLADEKAAPFVESVLDGEVRYTLTGKCQHCGKESIGEDAEQILKLFPPIEARLRAAELATRHGLPTKNEIGVASPEVVARLKQQHQVIASRPTWNSDELLNMLGAEVWK